MRRFPNLDNQVARSGWIWNMIESWWRNLLRAVGTGGSLHGCGWSLRNRYNSSDLLSHYRITPRMYQPRSCPFLKNTWTNCRINVILHNERLPREVANSSEVHTRYRIVLTISFWIDQLMRYTLTHFTGWTALSTSRDEALIGMLFQKFPYLLQIIWGIYSNRVGFNINVLYLKSIFNEPKNFDILYFLNLSFSIFFTILFKKR